MRIAGIAHNACQTVLVLLGAKTSGKRRPGKAPNADAVLLPAAAHSCRHQFKTPRLASISSPVAGPRVSAEETFQPGVAHIDRVARRWRAANNPRRLFGDRVRRLSAKPPPTFMLRQARGHFPDSVLILAAKFCGDQVTRPAAAVQGCCQRPQLLHPIHRIPPRAPWRTGASLWFKPARRHFCTCAAPSNAARTATVYRPTIKPISKRRGSPARTPKNLPVAPFCKRPRPRPARRQGRYRGHGPSEHVSGLGSGFVPSASQCSLTGMTDFLIGQPPAGRGRHRHSPSLPESDRGRDIAQPGRLCKSGRAKDRPAHRPMRQPAAPSAQAQATPVDPPVRARHKRP